MKHTREFFNCDCFTEGIILDSDTDANEMPFNVYLAFWTYGQGGQEISFFEKIRWCWNIMKTGLPWSDGVVMEWDEAKRLGKSILRRARISEKQFKSFRKKEKEQIKKNRRRNKKRAPVE